MPAPPPHLPAVLAWIPLVLVAAILAISALGVQVVPAAVSATPSDVGLTDVLGTVDVEVTLEVDCPSAAIANLEPGGVARESAVPCTMTFASNNPMGAELLVDDVNNLTADTMRCVVGACGAASLPELPTDPADPATDVPAGSSWFGVRLAAMSSMGAQAPNTVADWTINPTSLAGAHHIVPDAPEAACHTTEPGRGGRCSFHFAAQASASQPAGTYQADVRFEAQVR